MNKFGWKEQRYLFSKNGKYYFAKALCDHFMYNITPEQTKWALPDTLPIKIPSHDDQPMFGARSKHIELLDSHWEEDFFKRVNELREHLELAV